jgi:spore coat polysaccharide biosynthesis protein SpsF
MILGILQARVSSTRFPSKVLQPVLGRPMLARQIERVLRSRRIDKFVVATSTDGGDDAIHAVCAEAGVDCFRGSLENVLDRFHSAAKACAPEHVVRLTGDCPLADPSVIDALVRFYLEGGFDYASNVLEPTFPDGLDAEVFSFSSLETAWKEARLPSELEHPTSFLYTRPARFKLGSYKNDRDLSGLRWTVDTPADFELVTKVYEGLYPGKPDFTTRDILLFFEKNPLLMELNAGSKRNEGFLESLQNDKRYLEGLGEKKS